MFYFVLWLLLPPPFGMRRRRKKISMEAEGYVRTLDLGGGQGFHVGRIQYEQIGPTRVSIQDSRQQDTVVLGLGARGGHEDGL